MKVVWFKRKLSISGTFYRISRFLSLTQKEKRIVYLLTETIFKLDFFPFPKLRLQQTSKRNSVATKFSHLI